MSYVSICSDQLSPVDVTLVSGSLDKKLIIWDMASGSVVYKIDVHNDTINKVQIQVRTDSLC